MRYVRYALAAALLGAGVYAWLSYRVYKVPGAYEAESQVAQFPIHAIRPGDTLLLQNFNLGREPRAGDVVLYRRESGADGAPDTLIGRIVGLPGEKVMRAGPTMEVGQRGPLDVGFDFGADAAIKHGDVVPADAYLIVCDIDSIPYPDSRTLGYIERPLILRRVALNVSLSFESGR